MSLLDVELVRQAYEMVRPAIVSILEREMAPRTGVAVVVTTMEPVRSKSDRAGERFADRCLLVTTIGNLENSAYPNMEIALSKAQISARTGLPTAGIPPQYLLPGDTVFWGSVVLDGIVVACAGLDEYFDEMCSYWIAAAVQAVAKRRIAAFRTAHPATSFLSDGQSGE